MKKSFKLFAALLLAGGFALSLSSCKDSEDAANGPTPEEMAQSKDSKSAQGLLSVLSFTSQLDSLPDNWYANSYTVEPTVGTVNDQSTPFVRYIPVLNKQEAIAKYNSIADEVISENSTSATFNIENVGSVKFNVLDQTDCIATLDLNIKQQPHLTQIRFVPASAMGENAKLDGEPYYNFGDVVEVNENDRLTYWICVRPCSRKEKKSTSHWMSFNLHAWDVKDINNIKKLTKSNCEDYFVPTQLGDKSGSREHLQNLFKLLCILDQPAKYDNVIENGLGGIGKEEFFTKNDMVKLSEIWKIKNLWEMVLPKDMPRTNLTSCFEDNPEVNVFYYGYHNPLFSSTVSVHRAKLTGQDLHLETDGRIEWTRGENGVDFRSYANTGLRDAATDPSAGLPEKGFVVRYKTGRQLIGGGSGNDEDPTHSFEAKHSKIKDKHVYGKLDIQPYGASLVGDIITNEKSLSSAPTSNSIYWYCALGYAESNPAELGINAYYLKYKKTSKDLEKVTLQNLHATALAYVNLLNGILWMTYKKQSGLDGDVLGEEYKRVVWNLAKNMEWYCDWMANEADGDKFENVFDFVKYDTDNNRLPKDDGSSKFGKVCLTMYYADEATEPGHYKKAILTYYVENRKFEVSKEAQPESGYAVTPGMQLLELGAFDDIGDTPKIGNDLNFHHEGIGSVISRDAALIKTAEYIRGVAEYLLPDIDK